MTPTPSNPASEATTPGAASELLPCPFCGSVAMRNAPSTRWIYGVHCTSSGFCKGELSGFDTQAQADAAWNRRTPAPATEVAQREAAYECKCGWRGDVPDTGAILECPSCHSDWNIRPAPPPPDRVQPELVEAEHVSEVQRWKDKLFERYAQQTGTYRDLATIAAEMLVESAAREWRMAEAIANTREIGNG